MDATKKIGESSYSNRDGSDSARKHEDYVSGEEMLPKSKKPRMRMSESASYPRMKWSKDDELLLLANIIDFENERKIRYKSDYDALHRYVKENLEATFSKKQFMDKIDHLKKRFFLNLQTRSNTDDDGGLFNLSMIIWGNETQIASIENSNQPKDVSCVRQEHKDVPNAEQERVDMETSNAEKEKSGEDGVDVMKEILEAQASFKNLGKHQQKLLLENLGKLGVEKTKELVDEWKTLLIEELQLDSKKQAFSAKLANGGVSL